MQKLRALLPGSGSGSSSNNQNSAEATTRDVIQRHSIALEPEVGFQITIELSQQSVQHPPPTVQQSNNATTLEAMCSQKASIPELNVHLLSARHLPNLFGFKIVQGYQVKVKLFPGSKRLDSSIQTNSWPKFNENFRFPLAPNIKSSLKHSSSRASSKMTVSELFTPEELFAGQFVVFTVYALLELPPASFNRFNKTYRSLRDKSSNLVQKVVDSGKSKDDKENDENNSESNENQKSKRKLKENARDSMPALTIGESRRNLGSVTCYLEPKIFQRNPRTGIYATEELWLPIKDITTTAKKNKNNDLTNAPKGIVEIILEVRDVNKLNNTETNIQNNGKTFERLKSVLLTPPTTPTTLQPQQQPSFESTTITTKSSGLFKTQSNSDINGNKNQSWNRMTAEVKRKMGLSNISKTALQQNELCLRITTARMRCTQQVKDELECTAGSVYVKTAIFEHGIYVDSWKSPNFYPSLSTKWDINEEIATLSIPLHNIDSIDNILIRTTLATKTKMGKKLVLGTVLIGAKVPSTVGDGPLHIQQVHEMQVNQPIAMWHNYQ